MLCHETSSPGPGSRSGSEVRGGQSHGMSLCPRSQSGGSEDVGLRRPEAELRLCRQPTFYGDFQRVSGPGLRLDG